MDKKLIQVSISLPLVLVQVEVKDLMALFQDHKRLISCPNSLFQDHQRPLYQYQYTDLCDYYKQRNTFVCIPMLQFIQLWQQSEHWVVYITTPIKMGM